MEIITIYCVGFFNIAVLGQPPRRLSENRNLLRKSGFWPIFPIKFVKYSKYSPHLIKKTDSKPLSLATASILGQPPGGKNQPIENRIRNRAKYTVLSGQEYPTKTASIRNEQEITSTTGADQFMSKELFVF